jgi:hypothetical protein
MSMPSHLPKKLVIHQPWGGLGDNLQFSTLPELFAAHGVQSFISTSNAVRNPEIHQLVWGCNPFICGYSDEAPNAGACPPYHRISGGLPFLKQIEVAHGLAPQSEYPKVYYRPNKKPELAGAILMDLSSTSVLHPRSELCSYVNAVASYNHYDPADILQVHFDGRIADQYHIYGLEGFAHFLPKNIFDYCDALASCRAFITVHSGAQSLAVALRGDTPTPAIHCLCTPRQFNGRDYIFSGVDYRVAEKVIARHRHVRSILKRMPRTVRAYIDSKT